MESEQIENLKAHVKANPEFWMSDDFFIDLIQYHAVKKEENVSKEQTEKLFIMLSEANDPTKAVKLRNDDSDPVIVRQLAKGFVEEYEPNSLKLNLEESYATVLFNMKLHLGIKKISELKEEDFIEKFIALYSSDQYDVLINLADDLEKSLSANELISPAKIKKWQAKAHELKLNVVFGEWDEFVNNIGQLSVINRNKGVEIKEANFKITTDAQEIIRSGEKPMFTCQRIIDDTKQSADGRPITRALYNNFALAQTKVNGEIESRSILEVVSFVEDVFEGKESLMLVERLYSKGLVSAKKFYGSIIDWAAKHTDLNAVAIPEPYLSSYPTKPVSMDIPDYDAPIYRDTDWSKVKFVVDLEQYRKDQGLYQT